MNYIEQLNQFWQTRRSKRITNPQADLYFFLLNESSSRGSGNKWENPFQCPNNLIISGIGIAKSTLQDARNGLMQAGLIEVVTGIRNIEAPTYRIIDLTEKKPFSRPINGHENIEKGQSMTGTKADNRPRNRPTSGQETGQPPVHNIGINETKQKRNETSKSHSGANAPGDNKKLDGSSKADATEHWKMAVDLWFSFYIGRNTVKPSFEGPDKSALKSIMQRLKKMSLEANQQWIEPYAGKVLRHFFTKACTNDWLSANLTLPILSTKFDVIVNPKNDGTGKTNGAITGAKVNGEQLNQAFTNFYQKK